MEFTDFSDADTNAPEVEELPATDARLRPCRPQGSRSLGSYKKGKARWKTRFTEPHNSINEGSQSCVRVRERVCVCLCACSKQTTCWRMTTRWMTLRGVITCPYRTAIKSRCS